MGKVSAVFCTSHSSALLLPFERCQSVYRQVVERRGGRLAEPIQSASDAESWEDARHAHQAILAAVDQLRQRFAVANPDLVIMFGDDQLENLQLSAMPPFFSFIGATSFGHPLKLFQDFFGESPGYRREVAGSEYAPGLISGLVERGFDIAHSDRLPSAEWGLSHSIINVLHLLDIEKPVIPFLVNAFYEPAATPRRCFDLGLGIKEVIEETTPENCRVAVIGSGGLSHITRGERAGFVDAEHDGWVLEQLRAGRADQLATLTVQDLRECGNHELREWLPAVAMTGKTPPDWSELIISYRLLAGYGFAAWNLD